MIRSTRIIVVHMDHLQKHQIFPLSKRKIAWLFKSQTHKGWKVWESRTYGSAFTLIIKGCSNECLFSFISNASCAWRFVSKIISICKSYSWGGQWPEVHKGGGGSLTSSSPWKYCILYFKSQNSENHLPLKSVKILLSYLILSRVSHFE